MRPPPKLKLNKKQLRPKLQKKLLKLRESKLKLPRLLELPRRRELPPKLLLPKRLPDLKKLLRKPKN
jgi:hypothetical protein